MRKGSNQPPKSMLLKADSSSTSGVSQIKKGKRKMVAIKKKNKLTNKTRAISKVIGLDLPALDEKYNEDAMSFLHAQRIFEVKIVEDHLKIKYSDGRERELKIGSWESFHIYDLERINVLLNYEEMNERFWKIEIAKFLKLKIERDAELWRIGEEKRIKKEKEMEEIEEKARLLREKGLHRVKFNPSVVVYTNPLVGKRKLRMDYLDSYMASYLHAAADDLKDSLLIEEIEAILEIQSCFNTDSAVCCLLNLEAGTLNLEPRSRNLTARTLENLILFLIILNRGTFRKYDTQDRRDLLHS